MANPSQLEVVYGLCKNKDFRQQWEGLYDRTMMYVRLHCVELWSDNIWQDVVKFQVDGQSDVVKKHAQQLLIDVIKHFDEKIEKTQDGLFSEKMSLSVTRNDLRRTYESDPYKFIETLVRCLQEEEMLISSFSQPSEEQIQQENITQIIKYTQKCEELEQSFIQKVKSLNSLLDEERKKLNELTKKDQEKKDAQMAVDSSKKKNGVNPGQLLERIESDVKAIYYRLHQIDKEVDQLKSGIKDTLKQLLVNGGELQKRFSDVITKWKKQSKFKYVSLVESDYPLNGIDDRCKKFGKLLYSTLHSIQDDLLVLSCQKWEMEPDVDLQDTVNSLYKLFEQICQCTFLVTDQVRHLIKVELGSKKRTKDAAEDEDTKPGQKFKCPKFNATVRLIATESLTGRAKVKAYFCHQDTLNSLNKNNSWDELEIESFPMVDKSSSRMMGFGQQGFATFRHLELTQFRRDPDKHVCEEKYRIVFVTEQEVAGRKFRFRTLSLPIIITTGASQGSNAHGSLLWQCYSVEDLMQFPLQSPSELPWSTVAAMLNCKFKTLGGRDLRQDELMHLASRVSGLPKSNINQKTEIQFRKFCLDKMMDVKESKDAKNKSATFWMWVLSVYNLTKFHLQEYWNEGLIDGFSAKEDSDKKLKSIQPFKNYTFLLRFSDKVITDGQGQNMCGAVSAAFVYKTDDGEIKVGNARPFKAETFKKKSLAQLVKSVHVKEERDEVSLKYIYPGNQTRDEAFQSFYQPRTKIKDDYVDFEERLYTRLKDLSISDSCTPKEEPSNDVPVVKKSKQTTVEEVTSYPSYPEQQFNDMVSLDKFEQPSPSSTLFGGDRNSHESLPMSQEQSPASSYMMSPDNRYSNGSYNITSPLSNGMACSVTSPQSSIDESQVLSPEQEASIPITVLDTIGSNGVPVNGNLVYNQAMNGNHGFNQSGQGFVRSNSLPEQHPTLTNLLTNRNSVQELKKHLGRQNQNNDPSMQHQPMVTSEIDLNSVQKEITGGLPSLDITTLAMTLSNQYSDEIPPQNTIAMTLDNQYPDGEFYNMGEEVVLQDGFQTSELTQEQLQQFEQIQQSLGGNNNDMLQQQLLQMVTNPEQAQQFGTLFGVLNECMNLQTSKSNN